MYIDQRERERENTIVIYSRYLKFCPVYKRKMPYFDIKVISYHREEYNKIPQFLCNIAVNSCLVVQDGTQLLIMVGTFEPHVVN